MFTRLAPIVLATCLVAGACSSDDGDDGSSDTAAPTTTAAGSVTPTTTVAPATTVAPTTTVAMVVEGATVLVANSSITGGAAGRMTDQLDAEGFTTVAPTNGTERLVDSIVHHTDDAGAQEVAESLGMKLGGVEVSPMPDPIPTESGELDGAQVLLLLGNNQADRSFEELSGTDRVDNNGSVVVVANASGVSGSAGAMTSELSLAGFETGEPANALDPQEATTVHFTEAEGALEDAELVAELLGGVDVSAVPDPAPIEGDFTGDVLVLLGSNEAGQTLEELNV